MSRQFKAPGLAIYCPLDHLLARAEFRARPHPVGGDPALTIYVYWKTPDRDGAGREWGGRDGTGFPELRAACPCSRGRWWTLDPLKIAAAVPGRGRDNRRVADFLQ